MTVPLRHDEATARGGRLGASATQCAAPAAATPAVTMPEFSFLFGQFLGGLTAAMFLFLIASGLSLIFGVLRVLNFAHGSFYMIGAYLAWQFVRWIGPTGEGFWLAALGAALSDRAARRVSSSGCCCATSTIARSSTSCSSPTRWF